MEITKEIVIHCLCSLIACAAFGVQFNIRFRHLIAASVGSLATHLVYTLLSANGVNELKCCFIAAAAASLYSEIMAKCCKSPVNMYLIVSIIPLVPGGLSYYAMLALVMGDNATFLDRSVNALGTAGAIAMGIFVVSSAIKLVKDFKSSADKAIKNSSKKVKKPKGQKT